MNPLDLPFLIARYDRELDRKDNLTAAVGLPVTIVAALGGLIVTMANGFTYKTDTLTTAFVFALLLDTIFGGLCLFWLAKNYSGSEYEFVPRLGELEETRAAMEEEGEPRDLFEDLLRGSIIKAADANAKTNDTRSAFMDRANRILVFVLVTAALTGVLYVIDQVR
jgi:hypothetical protein